MEFINKNIEKYVKEGFNNVEGWCDAKVPYIIDMFDSLSLNKQGGACEIGIHHGRFFLLLNQTIEDYYNSYAMDVFNFQHLNIDNSGAGRKDIFLKNIQAYDRHKGKNIVILEEDSTDPRNTLKTKVPNGAFRFMSIDGGHTVEHTINDLQLASDMISNEGIVIVDDITNHWWMSVVEGVCKYLLNYPTLIPIAVGSNKLYMCKLSWHPYYYKVLNSCKFRTKESKFFGHTLISF